MMQKLFKKIINKSFILLIMFLALLIVFLGVQYERISRKQTILGNAIYTISNNIYSRIDVNKKYDLGNTFQVSSDFSFNFTSEEYQEKSSYDPEYYRKNNIINNLSNLNTKVLIQQDKEKGKFLFDFKNTIGTEDIFTGKQYVENATKYYFINQVLDTYVNGGNNRYFETITEENTTKRNIDYLYNKLIESIKLSIRETELKQQEMIIPINDKKYKTKQVSIKLSNKYLRVVLNRILEELQKDKRSKEILESFIPDFETYTIPEEREFLKENEFYEINVYVKGIFNTPIKYEVIHTNNNEEEIVYLEGSIEKGIIYYTKNKEIQYMANIESSPRMIEAVVYNEKKEKLGIIKVEKAKNSLSFSINIVENKDSLDLIYTSIFKNYVKNTSYEKEDNLNIKWLREGKVVINGNMSISSDITNQFKIEENIDNAVLQGTLNEETKEKFNNAIDNFKRRLES